MALNTVSVRVTSPNQTRIGSVSYEKEVNVKVDSQKDYAVKSVNYGVDRIRNLKDVYAFTPVDGDVLVFNAVTGKYVSKKLTSSQIDITNIDAGLF